MGSITRRPMTTITTVNFGRRRTILAGVAVAFGVGGWLVLREPENPMALAAPFVKANEVWTADHLFNFLNALPSAAMLDLKRTLGLLKSEDHEDKLRGSELDARDVQKETLWISQNIFSYALQDKNNLNYHDVVVWACKKANIAQSTIDGAPTFALEREIHKVLFVDVWDRMDRAHREEYLNKIDPGGAIKDKAAMAAMSGVAALALLNTAVAFGGFAFYTGMSVAIATAAAAANITLPFAAYSGASWMVGVLSGPIGWAAMTVTGIGGIALAGRANINKTFRLISAVHGLKVEALRASGMSEKAIYNL